MLSGGRLTAADREALIALVEAHEAALYRYLIALTNDRETARDCLQGTFVCAYEQLQRGRVVNTQWLYKVGRNRGIDELRRRRKERTDAVVSSDFPAATHVENLVSLRLAFRELAPDDRALLTLVVAEGLTGEEIRERVPTAVRRKRYSRCCALTCR